jgi:hypothetical protein
MVLSTIEDPAALDRLWPDFLSVMQAHRPPMLDEDALLRCLVGHAAYWFADRRGAQAGWSYAATRQLTDDLQAMLADKLAAKLAHEGTSQTRAAFREHARALHAREFPPFPACEHICTQVPAVCLYRAAAADLIATGRFDDAWQQAEGADRSAGKESRQQAWDVCKDAGYELIEFPEPGGDWSATQTQAVNDAAVRVSRCFGQQMIAGDPNRVPRTIRRDIERLLKEVHP